MDRPKPPRVARTQQAFTLVELLVVVVILGLLSAVVLPTLISTFDGTEPTPPREKPKPVARVGALPIFDKATIGVTLSVEEHRVGGSGFARYTANYVAEFVLQPTSTKDPMRLSVPFPKGADEAEDVSLSLHGGNYSGIVDPRAIDVGLDGVHWTGPVGADGAPIVARVIFVAKGVGDVTLPLPPAIGMRDLDLTVRTSGFAALPVPLGSLAPKRIERDAYYWEYKNLVSERPVMIELPSVDSPLARVILMLKLVGFAVLLFGAGFWYLVESYRPGHLTRFRLRHFLLLALTYSLFFAVFAVLGFQGVDPVRAFAIAALVAMPLLMWHVAAVVDWRFAAKYTLPLASLTIGVVVNGVYGGAAQSYVYLGVGAFIVAYLTFTMEGLAEKQKHRRDAVEADLSASIAAMQPAAVELVELEAEIASVLTNCDPQPLQSLRQEVQERTTEATRLAHEHARVFARVAALRGKAGFDRAVQRDNIKNSLRGMPEAMADAARRVREAVARLASRRAQVGAEHEAARRARAERDAGGVHCLCCGHRTPAHGAVGSTFCSACGVRLPVDLACGSCSEVFPLPVHLLDPEAPPQPLHCTGLRGRAWPGFGASCVVRYRALSPAAGCAPHCSP